MKTPSALRPSSRRLASFAGVMLIAGVGSLASSGPASALDVSYSSWDSGTNVLLDSAETTAAIRDGIYFTGPLCGQAITRAAQSGIPFPDRARSACSSAVIACAHDARARGNALSGARLFADGGYRCLVR